MTDYQNQVFRALIRLVLALCWGRLGHPEERVDRELLSNYLNE